MDQTKKAKENVRRLSFFLALLLVAAFLILRGGCEARTVQFTIKENGYAVKIRVGNRIKITLPVSPSAGYEWKANAYDRTVVQPVGEPAFSNDAQKIGGEATVSYTFEAVAPGKTTLGFEYRREWTKKTAATKTYSIGVFVK